MLETADVTAPRSESPRARSERSMRQWIENGVWSKGEKLPTEQALCRNLGVSRRTVRAALETLQKEGLIRNLGRQRSGRIVASPASPRKSGLMSSTIAIMTPKGGQVERVNVEGYMATVDSAVVDAAHHHGLNSLVLSANDLGEELVEMLLKETPRGFILNAEAADSEDADLHVKRLTEAGIPVVANTDDEKYAFADRVAFDHAEGTRLLVNALYQSGCRRILRLWETKMPWIESRNRGYAQAVTDLGLEDIPPVFAGLAQRGQMSEEDLEARARHFAGHLVEHVSGAKAIDAILTVTDSAAFPVARACRLFGKVPGKDIMIAGFDNYWRNCWEFDYEPTGVQFSVDKLNRRAGQLLVQTLIERTDATAPNQPKMIWITPELVEIS